jgi:hypothetical protein
MEEHGWRPGKPAQDDCEIRNKKQMLMKTLLLACVAICALAIGSGCASRTTIGTAHHHVTLGGDVHL